MNFLVLLDAGPLGMVTNPKVSDKNRPCKEWLRGLLAAGVRVMIPEGADYEVRRDLLLAGKRPGIARLDELGEQLGYLPITREALLAAAEIWARMRKAGTPTADAKALDFDVILGAQAQVTVGDDLIVIVATQNVGHLGRFCDAREWDRVGTSSLDPESAR